MGTDFSNKRIKCAVCGKEYGLNELHCPKCSYPALSFSNKVARQTACVKAYKKEKGYEKKQKPPVKKEPVKTNEQNKTVTKKVKQPENNTRINNQGGKGIRYFAGIVAAIVVAVILIHKFAPESGFALWIDSLLGVSHDVTTTEVTEEQQETPETQETTLSAEEAFNEYLADVITNADEYDGGYPVYYDSNGIDTITWEAYGFEDFDGDGEVEMLALRSFYRIGGKLTLYEFENGSVNEGKSVWFLGGLEELRNVYFYSNGVGFLSYEAVIDNGFTEYVYLFNDRYTRSYGVDAEQYLIFSHAEDGSIGFNTGPDYKGDDKIMSQSEYEDFTLQLHRDEDYASYWMLSPEFNEITH